MEQFREHKCDLRNIAVSLHDAGYRTALVGKFLNQYQREQASIVPPGWDFWRALTETAFYDFAESVDGTYTEFPKSDDPDTGGYQTYVLRNQAIEFIHGTPSDQPLFLYWDPHAPHWPATPAPGDNHRFDWMNEDGGRWRPGSWNEPDVSDKPPEVRAPLMSDAVIQKTDHFRELQYESLLSVDRSIGDILDELEATGRLSNTLVVFTSDNGMMWGEHRLAIMKNVPYEEAIRGPFVARWDGVIPAGTTDDRLAVNVDLAPTFAEVASATIPYKVDGTSLMPLLTGAPSDGWRHGLLLEHGGGGEHTFAPNYLGVRTDPGFEGLEVPYTFVVYYEDGVQIGMELYDLAADPQELTNLVGKKGFASVVDLFQGWLDANGYDPPPEWGHGVRYPGAVLDEDLND